MMQIITRDYQGHAIAYQGDGWFNATQAAAQFGRRVDKWMENVDTQDYISALCEISNTPKSGYLKTKRGANGGTWLHPKLAVHFARWLDTRFAIWCDEQIDALLRGNDDRHRLRHEAASSFKVLSAMLMLTRQDSGKATEPHHYANEARLVNWALCGEFQKLERDSLSDAELALLAFLEQRNAVLIGRGLSYDQRKPMLKQYAMDWQLDRLAINGEAAA